MSIYLAARGTPNESLPFGKGPEEVSQSGHSMLQSHQRITYLWPAALNQCARIINNTCIYGIIISFVCCGFPCTCTRPGTAQNEQKRQKFYCSTAHEDAFTVQLIVIDTVRSTTSSLLRHVDKNYFVKTLLSATDFFSQMSSLLGTAPKHFQTKIHFSCCSRSSRHFPCQKSIPDNRSDRDFSHEMFSFSL